MKELEIIKASAGTGKTYTLTMEYIKNLLNNVLFNEIVIVTFTNKATLEIKERILDFIYKITIKDEKMLSEIEKSIRKLNDKDIELLKSIYKNLLLNTDQLRVYTIDSFVNKLFSIITLKNNKTYLYNINEKNNSDEINEIIEKLFVKNKDKFIDLVQEINDKEDYDIEEFNEIVSKILSNRILISEKINLINSYDLKFNENYESNFLDTLKYIIDVLKSSLDKKILYKNIEDNLLILDDINKYNMFNYFKIIYKEYKKKFSFFKKTSKNLDEELVRDVELKMDELLSITNLKIYDFNLKIAYLSKEIFKIYDEIKIKNKEYTFDDVSFYVYKELKDKKSILVDEKFTIKNEVLKEIGGTIKQMYIDEFQDTTLLQFEILLSIARNIDKLVCVGDLKQSIYKFRGGDKEIFENIEKIVRKYNENILIKEKVLNKSYRSKKIVIDSINKEMKPLLSNYIDTETSDEENKGYFYKKKIKKDEAIENIVEKLKTKNLKNVAIIAQTTNTLVDVSKVLKKNNIKYYFAKKNDILSIDHVKSLYNLFMYFETNNLIYLINHLTSNDINYSQDKLKKVYDNLHDIEKIEDKYILKLLEFKKIIKETSSEKQGAFNFLKNYLKEDIHTENLDEETLKNVFKLFNIYISSNDRFKTLVDMKEKIIKKDNVDNENAVELITVHSSKGLQYKTVFYIDKSMRNNSDKIKIFKDYDYEKGEYKYINIVSSKYIDFIFDEKEESLKENEKINIFYVAITRAEKELYLYNITSSKEEYEEEYGEELIENIDEEVLEDNFEYEKIAKYLKKSEIDKFEKMKKSVIQEYSRKEGLAFHYFMQYLIKKEDYDYALKKLKFKYGNLIGKDKINYIIKVVDKFIESYKYIFEADEIYTEYEIFDENNNKKIIDRINFLHKEKKINIYDYKTEKDPNTEKNIEQIKKYKEIIQKMYNDYEVNTEILKIGYRGYKKNK